MIITATATGIRCGKCSTFSSPVYHATVADVRACHLGGTPTPVQAANMAADAKLYDGRPAAWKPLASEKQRTFLLSLAEEREVPVAGKTEQEARNIATVENVQGDKAVTVREASDAIAYLLAQPRVAGAARVKTTTAKLPEVPAGRYAITVDGITKFYRVDRPTEGRWAGRTFVKIQASDELHPVRGEAARAVLEAIAKDPAAASKLYGREIGACGVCGRTLTDETSRANGIGPICAAKAGW